MKQFIKYTAILGAVLSILGFGTAWAAKINGGDWRRDDIWAASFSIPRSEGKHHWDWDEDYEIHVETVSQDDYTLNVPAAKNLNLKLEAGEIVVTTGEVSDISIICDKPEKLEDCLKIYKEEDEDELEFYVKGKVKKDGSYPKVTIVIPAGYQFHEVEISVGAGSIEFTGMNAQDLNVEVAAGNATIQEAVVSDADFECVTGNISYSGTIQGDVEGESAMGNISLILMQKESDFNYELEGVGGSIRIGENEFGGLGFERNANNNTLQDMDLHCVTGSIQVDFTGM
ncbi:MAG: DUF4097 domain-containing protein [Lachnospiraceae bacterium]|jgi:hypothetical protein|nr:DUF4097 domain-containing protein [Lachnospiraceae bacterium]